MASIPDRSDLERELAATLLLLWRKADRDPLFRGVQAAQHFTASTVSPVLEKVYAAAARRLADQARLDISQDVIDRNAAIWAMLYAAELANQLNMTTLNRVNAAAAGLGSVTSIPAEIVDDAFNQERAAVIAATEITRAATAAETALAAVLVVKPASTWNTAEDERVCEVCGPLNGTGPDVYGAVSLSGPPAHPNCRCWLEWNFGP